LVPGFSQAPWPTATVVSTGDAHLGAAVARVWPDGVDAWEPLGGGITNHNVKVVRGDDVLVLRVAGRDTDLLGIDRSTERVATEAAAALGVGPEVVAFVEPEGWLVTRFIDGRIPPPQELAAPPMLERVAVALRAVHGAPAIPGRFDALAVADAYRETALARGGAVPDAFDWAHELGTEIRERRTSEPLVPCHNDLLNANFLDDGTRIRIVDWEYAGMGDPFFDLANFAINHELDADGREALLRAYLGEPTDAQREALELMRFMSDFREAMWGVVQGAVSELDFDFARYASEHFARMERTAAEPSFRSALRA
jgi:thiamine kinase-like enzyme